MGTITLPDGLTLHIVSKVDAKLEYHANSEHQVYFGNGSIKINPGSTVLDVGANIGSFARVAAAAAGPSGHVLCMEPLPQLQRALGLNLKAFQQWAAQRGQKVACTTVIAAGAGAEPGSQASFTYYPRCTALSTQYPDVPDVLAATASLVCYSPRSYSLLQRLGQAVARMVPGLYHIIHAAVFPALYLTGAQQELCSMMTISQVIQEHKIKCVDLLKVNVERAELDVLRGVRQEDWPRVHQVSVQVHDIGGRVGAVKGLLTSVGFEQVTAYKEPRFRGCCLYMVYASRC